ncbi:MAG TPA: 23S rRNA (guanosine(2251)-2'-O)-methyltransferase RlmB [Gammaproteobacteria bacterium]|nr:23S rRNA (guanosine(2251)-2'-O)-methyltransferase RlmB [Gammaproteobacteria bacterium]
MSDNEELIYGLHAVLAALQQHPEAVAEVWIDRARRDPRAQKIRQAAAAAGVALHEVSARVLAERAGDVRHQGVAARGRAPRVRDEADLEALLGAVEGPPLLLVLDGVTDPHNLGACLRSADGAGTHAVIAPRDRACGLTPVARKVASGAAESVPFIQVTNLARTLRWLKEQGIWLIGADGTAEGELFDVDLSGPIALVLGAEGAGLRRLTREHCDILARLPMRGRVDSLNVSVSAGIFLYEALRQRRHRP